VCPLAPAVIPAFAARLTVQRSLGPPHTGVSSGCRRAHSATREARSERLPLGFPNIGLGRAPDQDRILEQAGCNPWACRMPFACALPVPPAGVSVFVKTKLTLQAKSPQPQINILVVFATRG
jgi:hypothetical protein